MSPMKKGYLNSDFRIFHLKDSGTKEYQSHYHDFHKITIFISGHVQYFVEGRVYELEPYDIILVNRNEMHRILVDESLTYERIIVYISPSFLEAYKTSDCDLGLCFEKARQEQSSVLRIPSLKKSSLFQSTLRLENSFEDTDYANELYRQVLFLEFMIQLNRSATQNHLEYLDTTRCHPKVAEVIHYVNLHLTDSLEIDTLSRQVFLSKYYLMRLFKEETGWTIGNYIHKKRLLLARDQIRDGLPATEACYNSGFRDYSTFSRAYKKEFHTSPSGDFTGN